MARLLVPFALLAIVGGIGSASAKEKLQDLSYTPPAGFIKTKDEPIATVWKGTLTTSKVSAFLEHWSLPNPGIKATTVAEFNAIDKKKVMEICPKIGPITTCIAERAGRVDNTPVFAIRQVTSVNHTPLRAVGYLVLGADRVYVSRMVTPHFEGWEKVLPAEIAKLGLSYKDHQMELK